MRLHTAAGWSRACIVEAAPTMGDCVYYYRVKWLDNDQQLLFYTQPQAYKQRRMHAACVSVRKKSYSTVFTRFKGILSPPTQLLHNNIAVWVRVRKPRAFPSVPVGESSTEPALGRCRLSSGSRLSSFSAASIYFQPLRMHIGFQHLPLGLDRGHLE